MDTIRRWAGRFYMGAFLALLVTTVWVGVNVNEYTYITGPLVLLGFVIWVVASVLTFWGIDRLQPYLIDANKRRRLNFHWSRSYWTLAALTWIAAMIGVLFKLSEEFIGYFSFAGVGIVVVCGLFRRWVMYVTRADVEL